MPPVFGTLIVVTMRSSGTDSNSLRVRCAVSTGLNQSRGCFNSRPRLRRGSNGESRPVQTVAFQRVQKLAMSECRTRRGIASLARRPMDQRVGGIGLHQAGLAIAARPKHDALCEGGCAAPADDIDGAVLTAVFPRRRPALYRICHLRQLLLLLFLRQGTDVFFEVLFGGQNGFHNLAVQ